MLPSQQNTKPLDKPSDGTFRDSDSCKKSFRQQTSSRGRRRLSCSRLEQIVKDAKMNEEDNSQLAETLFEEEALWSLIKSVAASFGYRDSKLDELVSCLAFQLWRVLKAHIHTFDPTKASIETWLQRCIERKIIDHRRTEKKIIRSVSLQVLGEIVDRRTDQDTTADLREAIEKLSPYLRAVVELRYFQGKAIAELVKQTGLSQRMVYYRLSTAKGCLQKMLTSEVDLPIPR